MFQEEELHRSCGWLQEGTRLRAEGGVTERNHKSFACLTEQSGSYTEDYGESPGDFKENHFRSTTLS